MFLDDYVYEEYIHYIKIDSVILVKYKVFLYSTDLLFIYNNFYFDTNKQIFCCIIMTDTNLCFLYCIYILDFRSLLRLIFDIETHSQLLP